MKIAVRGGHNFSVRGASGLIDETTEDRKVKDSVIKYLKSLRKYKSGGYYTFSSKDLEKYLMYRLH